MILSVTVAKSLSSENATSETKSRAFGPTGENGQGGVLTIQTTAQDGSQNQ